MCECAKIVESPSLVGRISSIAHHPAAAGSSSEDGLGSARNVGPFAGRITPTGPLERHSSVNITLTLPRKPVARQDNDPSWNTRPRLVDPAPTASTRVVVGNYRDPEG